MCDRGTAGKVVTVAIDDNQFRILHDGIQLSARPTTFVKEVTRRSASEHATYEMMPPRTHLDRGRRSQTVASSRAAPLAKLNSRRTMC